MLLPILGGPLESCLGDLRVEPDGGPDGEPTLRYFDHVLPLRPGTARLPMRDLLDSQHYRLAWWRDASAELNWRRFFNVTSLIGVRVEEPAVFDATHEVILRLVAEGLVDGLRIDHPDGLADPRGYLARLASATDGAWVVVEKILETDETLPADWACAGTTGYDGLKLIDGLFLDPGGGRRAHRRVRAVHPAGRATTRLRLRFADVAAGGQARGRHRDAGGRGDAAGPAARRRLPRRHRGRDPDRAGRGAGRVPGLPRLRAPGRTPVGGGRGGHQRGGRVGPQAAAARAPRAGRRSRPGRARLHRPVGGAAGRAGELVVRFQQTTGPVLAKGVEDTAFYRWSRLLALNEVGGDPDRCGVTPAAFHAQAERLAADWPFTMTTLSTHDTKRQEDVRARLAVLAEMPGRWGRQVGEWHERAVTSRVFGETAAAVDPDTEYLIWQTLVGAWPISGERLAGYLTKAVREADRRTSWTDPDAEYEAAVLGLAARALDDPELSGSIGEFVAAIAGDALANSLGAKLVQLTMVGVPDIYQGCELSGLSLVDPDNRRPVDFARRRALLADLDAGRLDLAAATRTTADPRLDAAKLLVTARALRLRRARPEWFAGGYAPVTAVGPAADHVVAFARGGAGAGGPAVTVATRLPVGLRARGGWSDTVLPLAGRAARMGGRAHRRGLPRATACCSAT